MSHSLALSEPVSAAQLSLLKLYDAYLQTSGIKLDPISNSSTAFLVPALVRIMSFLTSTMQALVEGGDGSIRGSPFSDLRFEKVYGALVLVLQCTLKLGLAEGGRSHGEGARELELTQGNTSLLASLKLTAAEPGVVEQAVGLYHYSQYGVRPMFPRC